MRAVLVLASTMLFIGFLAFNIGKSVGEVAAHRDIEATVLDICFNPKTAV